MGWTQIVLVFVSDAWGRSVTGSSLAVRRLAVLCLTNAWVAWQGVCAGGRSFSEGSRGGHCGVGWV
eukprot:3362158-Rhodomonas_salina.1